MKVSRLLVSLFALALVLIITGCTRSPVIRQDNNVDYYTCTMHPSVRSKVPGKCPICGMDLVPVYKKTSVGQAAGSADASPGEFTVPVERRQQIGVTCATVEKRPLRAVIRAVGSIAPAGGRLFDCVSRLDGYVISVPVDSPGLPVVRGQALASIDSPDLLSAEEEFVRTLPPAKEPQPADAARRRLTLMNLDEDEINELAEGRKPSGLFVLRSPVDGIITDVSARPGMAVKAGDRLAGVADLSTVWLWAEFYEDELSQIVPGSKVEVSLPAFPVEQISGTVSVVDPFIDPVKRTARVRVDLPNPGGILRPGMYADAEIKLDAGDQLSIPASAVLPTGTRFLVFVDKGEGRLEPRFPRLGRELQNTDAGLPEKYYPVAGGLVAGERVVASGNFLIDAESKIQGAVQTWSEDTSGPQPSASPSGEVPIYQSLLGTYLAIRDQLAQDKADGLPELAQKLHREAEVLSVLTASNSVSLPAYRQQVDSFRRAAMEFKPATLDAARVQFGRLGDSLIELFTQFPTLVPKPLYVMKCPMWSESPGRWIQITQAVENPFLGQVMPACGTLVSTIGDGK